MYYVYIYIYTYIYIYIHILVLVLLAVLSEHKVSFTVLILTLFCVGLLAQYMLISTYSFRVSQVRLFAKDCQNICGGHQIF